MTSGSCCERETINLITYEREMDTLGELLMIPRCFMILGLLTIASNGFAQEPVEEVVRVTIRPAAAPVPALKYEFLPEFRDQISGNALIHYHRAALLAGKPPESDDKYWNWVV